MNRRCKQNHFRGDELDLAVRNFLWIFFCLCILNATAQSSEFITHVPDTSFTTNSDYQKNIRKYPFIKIVPDSAIESVREQRKLVYCEVEKRTLHIDAFYRWRNSHLTPAILIIHGGGWRSGNPQQHVPLAQRLAALGYATFTVEYRLSTDALYPAAVNDIKAAVRWLRANAKTFSIDTAKIAILGFSAGGQLAALVGVTSGRKKFDNDECSQSYSDAVHAVIDIDGTLSFIHPESSETQNPENVKSAAWWLGYKRTERIDVWKEASPLSYADKNTIPFLFLNSSVDRMHAGRDDFKKLMDSRNVYTEIFTFGDAPHSFCLYHPWFNPTLRHIDTFLKKIFADDQ
jgi:acetyl esterase/lipase